MKKHEKKLTQPYFDYVRLGIKTFELRKNDCDYQVGDLIILKEWRKNEYTKFDKIIMSNPQDWDFTGREITARITYMLEDYAGLEKGYCILGIEVLEK